MIHQRFLSLLLLGVLLPSQAIAQHDNRAVLGPRNLALADGAQAILEGDARKGVELTLQGLMVAQGQKERENGYSNLCAAYALIGNLDAGLRYCNLLLALNDRSWRGYNNRAVIFVLQKEYEKAERDLEIGESINPYSRKLKETRAMLLDATHPVEPKIVIDDRGELDGSP